MLEYLSKLAQHEVGKGAHARVVAMMGVAENPKIRAVLLRNVEGTDQLGFSIAQVSRQAGHAQTIADSGEKQEHAAGSVHEFCTFSDR